jgi:hypothetical protein
MREIFKFEIYVPERWSFGFLWGNEYFTLRLFKIKIDFNEHGLKGFYFFGKIFFR